MKLSIIITVYNKEKYLKKCFESVIKQLNKNVELIVIDDCSTDASYEVIKEYKKTCPDMIVIKNQKNRGVSWTRNKSISKVSGEYFTFIDGDDIVKEDFVDYILKSIKKYPGLDVYSYRMSRIDPNTNEIIENVFKASFDLTDGYNALYKVLAAPGTFDTPVGYVYKKKYWDEGGFLYLENTYHEDFGLTPLVIMYSKKAFFDDYNGYYNIMSDDSIMRTTSLEKERKKCDDFITHAMNLIREFNDVDNIKYKATYKTFVVDALIRKIKLLDKSIRKEYIKKLKKLKLYQFLEVTTFKSFIKKIIVFLSFNLYLTITK